MLRFHNLTVLSSDAEASNDQNAKICYVYLADVSLPLCNDNSIDESTIGVDKI